VIYKPYPVCNITQAPVEVAARLSSEHGLAPGEVTAVRLYLSPADYDYPGTLQWGPFADPASALMSAPFCVALGLKHRTATLAALAELDDEEILGLVARTEVHPDERLPLLAARVELETARGERLVAELVPDETTYNWDWDGVVRQAELLAEEMPDGGASLPRLQDEIRRLDEAADVGALVQATAPLASRTAS
jgi:2-methylcitrate dehydratase PrpD